MKNKLVMTLLVRDEEDILEYNICHHLNQGIDFIIAIDNGSTDGTIQILKKYQDKGVLTYSVVNEHTYKQDVWVSSMAKEAVKKYGATHLFHCDADEFWFPTKGNMKGQLSNIKDVVYVPLINYIPSDINIEKFSFNNFHYIVTNPIKYTRLPHKSDSSKVLIYEYPKKIMTTNKFTNIDYGNHQIKHLKKYQKQFVNNIFIHHFSIRSYKHFQNKVVNIGSSILNNPPESPDTFWQFKKWYSLYLRNKLNKEYEKISLKKTLQKYLKSNIIRRTSVPIRIKHAKIIYIFTEIKNIFTKLLCQKKTN